MLDIPTIKANFLSRDGEDVSKWDISSIEGVTKSGGSAKVYFNAICNRCNGTGIYTRYHGVCWKCMGAKRVEYSERVYEKSHLAKMNATAEKKRLKVAATRDAEWSDWIGDHVSLLSEVFEYQDEMSFLKAMVGQLEEKKPMSDRQIAACNTCIATAKTQVANRKETTKLDAESDYVGEVGDRIEITAEVVAHKSGEGFYGEWYFYLLRDHNNNLLVHIGSMLGLEEDGNYTCADPGDVVTLKATIKGHDTRDGVKQTRINRPKVSGIIIKEESEDE